MEVVKTAIYFLSFQSQFNIERYSFFITVIICDFTRIFSFYTSEEFEITPSSWSITFSIFLFIALPLLYLLFLFFLGLIEGLGPLSGLVSLILILVLALGDYVRLLGFFKLFFAIFSHYLYDFLILKTSNIEVSIV